MKIVIALTALLLGSAPAHAQWEPVDEVLQVRIAGKGAWVVRCDWVDRKGKPQLRELRGRGDRLYINDAASGSCTYQAAPDQPLTLRLKSPLYRCTLPARETEMCRQTFAAGAAGSFQVVRRD